MTKLFKESYVTKMSPITQKLDTLLKAGGYSLLECGRMENSPSPPGASYYCPGGFVNQLEYWHEEEGRIFLITHEKARKRSG